MCISDDDGTEDEDDDANDDASDHGQVIFVHVHSAAHFVSYQKPPKHSYI